MNKQLRRRIVEMITRAKEGHIPSAFSIVDIVATLYRSVLKPEDRFVLSKGHGCAALYVVLEEQGIISSKDIEEYGTFEGILGGHPDRTKVPGVECSTGSLGHGFPMAVGMALAKKIKREPGRIYCLVGDGECHEGTTWESALVAAHMGLNLTLIVDYNGSAAQILPHPNIKKQFEAFGWHALSVDGHDPKDIECTSKGAIGPRALIAHTVKGNGIPMIEGHGPWHHKIPNAQEYEQIMAAL